MPTVFLINNIFDSQPIPSIAFLSSLETANGSLVPLYTVREPNNLLEFVVEELNNQLV